MRRATARTGQAFWLFDRPCPTTSPLVPFFCVVKVRLTNVLSRSVSTGDLLTSTGEVLIHSLTSQRRKGWESNAGFVYSPGRRRKKKAIHIMSEAARAALLPSIVANLVASWRIGIGIGFTRVGCSSNLAYPFNCRAKRGWRMFLLTWNRGSGSPTKVNVCATKLRTSATVLDRTHWPLAESLPSRTLAAKI